MGDGDPYPLKDGKPRLVDSFVLLLDVLGTKHLGSQKNAQAHLEKLYEALEVVRKRKILQPVKGYSKVLTFADSLVLGEPGGAIHVEETGKLGGIFLEASLYQLELTCRGIFVRGGLARGHIFMGDNFAFGPALGDAYDLERNSAVYPRIVLDRQVLKQLREDMWHYATKRDAPQYHEILQTSDSQAFLSYLAFLLDEEPADAYQELVRHKEAIERGLADWRSDSRIWEKYRWSADYHNHFCTEYYQARKDLMIDNQKVATEFRRIRKGRTRPPFDV